MTVTAGSLFSGIGGAEVGAALAGLPTRWVWQVVTDVRTASAACLAPVDVLAGGPPCPDFSVAGKGAGLAGDNGRLSYEFFRLVRELRPRVVLMENVTGILARGFGDLLGELASCGYDAEWDCVPASAVGAPHQRDRVWLVAYPQRGALRVEPERHQRKGRGERAAECWHAEPVVLGEQGPYPYADGGGRECERVGRLLDRERAPCRGDVDGLGGAGFRQPGSDVADTSSTGRQECLAASEPGSEGHTAWRHPSWRGNGGWVTSSAVRRVDVGLPAGVDRRLIRRRDRARLRALGNAWCPWASVPAWRRVRQILDV